MLRILNEDELKEIEQRMAEEKESLKVSGAQAVHEFLYGKTQALTGDYCSTQQSPSPKQPQSTLQNSPAPVALKYDSGKPDLSQVTLELVEELARVRMFGEKKYARDNWKKGFKVTRSLAAALRHIFRFLSGETLDSESGLSHLGHAVACLEHAIWDMKHNPSNDDRYKKGEK